MSGVMIIVLFYMIYAIFFMSDDIKIVSIEYIDEIDDTICYTKTNKYTFARVHYLFNGDRYSYVCDEVSLPKLYKRNCNEIHYAKLLIYINEEYERDVTQKIREYAGPYGDFYDEDVNVSRIFFPEELSYESSLVVDSSDGVLIV
jgi:hypothetical protein